MISQSVPIYNKEGSIEEVTNRHGAPWETIFVNDWKLGPKRRNSGSVGGVASRSKVLHFRRNFKLYLRTTGYFFAATPLPMMAVISFRTGVICILMGLHKSIYLVRKTRNINSFPKAA